MSNDKKRMISVSMGRPDEEAQYDWPEDCKIQAGGNGIVFTNDGDGSYRTAFFEAFPRNPNTFLRGEGTTIAEAETACWKQYLVATSCEHGEYERRKYTNGSGYCVHCGTWFSGVFEPLPEDPDKDPSFLEKVFTDPNETAKALDRYFNEE